MTHTTLEEASELITDGTHGSPQRTEDANGVPLLSAKNVFDGEIRWDEFDRVPPSEWEEFNKRVSLKRGDVLMTCVGTIGRAAVWLNEKPVVFFRSVAIIRPKPTLISSYLEYVIRSDDFQNELRRRTKRSSQGGVYLKDIKTMPIAVPPLLEQERIVKLLDEADELRKLRTQADRRTAALIPSLFHEMFGDPFTSPKGCSVVRVDEAGRVQLGRQRAPKYQTGKFTRPYVRVANVYEDEIDVDDLLSMDFDKRDFAQYRLEHGDILLNEGQSTELVGRPAMWRNEIADCCFQNTLVRFQHDRKRVLPDFALAVFLAYFRGGNFANISSKTSNVAHLGAARFAKMPFPLPPLPQQKEFAARVSEIRAVQSEQSASRRRLDDLFQSLLHRAFNGEL